MSTRAKSPSWEASHRRSLSLLRAFTCCIPQRLHMKHLLHDLPREAFRASALRSESQSHFARQPVENRVPSHSIFIQFLFDCNRSATKPGLDSRTKTCESLQEP